MGVDVLNSLVPKFKPNFVVGDVVGVVYEDNTFGTRQIRQFHGLCTAIKQSRFSLKNYINNCSICLVIDGRSSLVLSVYRGYQLRKRTKSKLHRVKIRRVQL